MNQRFGLKDSPHPNNKARLSLTESGVVWLSAWLSTNDRDALPGKEIKPVEGSDLHKHLVRLEGLEPPTF